MDEIDWSKNIRNKSSSRLVAKLAQNAHPTGLNSSSRTTQAFLDGQEAGEEEREVWAGKFCKLSTSG